MKKKSLLRILSALLLITLLLTGCGPKSPDELIVGRWVLRKIRPQVLSFFSDGDAVGFNGDDTYEAN